jgi:DNA-binding beta-propeller fold protein YncE
MRSFIKLTMAAAVIGALSLQARAAGMFEYPVSIAIDKSDNIIVSEPERHRVDKYDYGLGLKWRTGIPTPVRLAVNSSENGDVFVVDSGAGVKRLSATDGSIQPLGAPLSQVAHPVAIAIDGSNFIYVLGQSGLVQKFSYDGTQQLGSWGGTPGSGDGQFSNPTDIAVGPGGAFAYIADTGNNRIQKWQLGSDSIGNLTYTAFIGWMGRCTTNRIMRGGNCNSFLQASRGFSCTAATCSPASAGSGAGQFTNPSGLGLNGPNFLFVADFGNSRIQEFQSTGTYLAKFGTYGMGPGQLTRPTDVAVDSLGNVWATDGPAGRLVEFGPTGNPIQTFGGNVGIAAAPGSPPPLNVDPVFDPRALLVFAGNPLTSTITLTSLGYVGGTTIEPACCLDFATTLPATSSGINYTLFPQYFNFTPQQQSTSRTLTVSAMPPTAPTPGKYIATVTVADPTGTMSNLVGVGFEVLPPWPGDGPVPACMPGLQVLKLSMLDLFKFRQTMTTAPTIFEAGVAIKSTDPHCMPTGCAGIELDVTGTAGQVPPDRATVFVSNPSDGDVSVTTSDSRNCSSLTVS